MTERSYKTMVENCENCAFGVDAGLNYKLQCRRHAPIAQHRVTGVRGSTDILGMTTNWPIVNQTDFCGDFELKG